MVFLTPLFCVFVSPSSAYIPQGLFCVRCSPLWVLAPQRASGVENPERLVWIDRVWRCTWAPSGGAIVWLEILWKYRNRLKYFPLVQKVPWPTFRAWTMSLASCTHWLTPTLWNGKIKSPTFLHIIYGCLVLVGADIYFKLKQLLIRHVKFHIKYTKSPQS